MSHLLERARGVGQGGAVGGSDAPSVRAYQAAAGLVADGICGPMTRSAQAADAWLERLTEFVGFRGSFGVLIRCEGFRGVPYWPRGQSGVTLDYGWDLGRQSEADLRRLYGSVWSDQELAALAGAIGLRGDAARRWLRLLPGERIPPGYEAHDAGRWLITPEQAAQILPRAAAPYWLAAVAACPALATAPGRVQSALLSAAYSAWLAPVLRCRAALEAGEWGAVAVALRGAKGHKGRRAFEAAHITGGLG